MFLLELTFMTPERDLPMVVPSTAFAPVPGGGLNVDRVPHAMIRHRGDSFQRLKDENSALLREDIARRATVFRALPEILSFNHTEICNLRCIMCPRHVAQGKHRLSRRAVDHVATELFPTAKKAILTAAAGEPLSADFDLLLERALQFGVRLDVVTNGTLLRPGLYRRARHALDHLNVSVDCHIPEIYEKIRLGARFEVVADHLRAIREIRTRQPDDVLLSISAVVLRTNLPHLAGFVRFARREVGANGVVLQRLRHEVKSTRDEDPQLGTDPVRIRQAFEPAARAAREEGINLYLSDFFLENVIHEPLRDKIPEALMQQEACWFVLQYFGIMYSGEVYPCATQTDHCLGNLLYEDPAAIWNGQPAQDLRRAHWDRSGTAFCMGCEYAPHIPQRRSAATLKALRMARVAVRHFSEPLRRRLTGERLPIYAPRPPELQRVAVEWSSDPLLLNPASWFSNEVLTLHPQTSHPWWVRDGILYTLARKDSSPRVVATLPQAQGARATALQFLADGTFLLAFEEQGVVYRGSLKAASARLTEWLKLSDPRAFVRQEGLVVQGNLVWLGEYGMYPGARCAHLYSSRDAGQSVARHCWIERAKHIHRLAPLDVEAVLVTTGDLADERCMYQAQLDRPLQLLRRPWAGFTAVHASAGVVHCGTDLDQGNGFLRLEGDLRGIAEFRALPREMDLQVRQVSSFADGSLLALLSLDADLERAGRTARLLYSRDAGQTWATVHKFAADWSDVPEGFVILPEEPAHVLSVCAERALQWVRRRP